MYKSYDGLYIYLFIYLFIYFTVYFYQRITPTKVSLNLLAPELFFLILAHSVYKM